MSLPTFPELPMKLTPLEIAKLQMQALRQSLQRVCADIDEQIRALDYARGDHSDAVGVTANDNDNSLFENPPAGFFPAAQSAEMSVDRVTETRLVLQATGPSVLAPELEQATLEELNSALSKAFTQMAGKIGW